MIGNVIWLAIYLINVHQRRETLNICWLLFVYLFVCYYLMILCLVSQCDQYHVSQSVASEEYIGCHFFYFYFYFLHNTVCCLWRNIKQGERLFSDFVHWFHLQSQSLTTRLPVREVLCRLCFQPDSTASTCSFVCVEEVKKKKKLRWIDYSLPITSRIVCKSEAFYCLRVSRVQMEIVVFISGWCGA